jgi:hypothetical protein
MDNKSKVISGNAGGSVEIIDQPISPTGGSEGKGIPSPESTGSSAVAGLFKPKTKRRSQVWGAQRCFISKGGSRKHLCTLMSLRMLYKLTRCIFCYPLLGKSRVSFTQNLQVGTIKRRSRINLVVVQYVLMRFDSGLPVNGLWSRR